MYDVVAGIQCLKSSYVLSKTKALELFPMLKKDKLVGAIVYYDGESKLSACRVFFPPCFSLSRIFSHGRWHVWTVIWNACFICGFITHLVIFCKHDEGCWVRLSCPLTTVWLFVSSHWLNLQPVLLKILHFLMILVACFWEKIPPMSPNCNINEHFACQTMQNWKTINFSGEFQLWINCNPV